ncbi:MAG: hypothetical protein CVV52_03725 [Spirochaetae bacterium HGW-Spirochaetae-8]|jgi:hypothetical protein|nr:MAG: hypothetical protein CVV52_03725 [Spirochaetae bacterium HGW-Spirochaetae-8]
MSKPEEDIRLFEFHGDGKIAVLIRDKRNLSNLWPYLRKGLWKHEFEQDIVIDAQRTIEFWTETMSLEHRDK